MRYIKASIILLLATCLLMGVAVDTVGKEDGADVPQPFSASLVCLDPEASIPSYARQEVRLGPELHLRRLRTPTWSIFVQASDPDLTGQGSLAMNGDIYWSGSTIKEATTIAEVSAVTIRFGPDEGTWTGTWYLYDDGGQEVFPTDVIRLEGDGSFQGRTALASIKIGSSFCSARLTGVTFPDAPPEPPAAPTE